MFIVAGVFLGQGWKAVPVPPEVSPQQLAWLLSENGFSCLQNDLDMGEGTFKLREPESDLLLARLFLWCRKDKTKGQAQIGPTFPPSVDPSVS